jgi:hypothetical protein
MKYKHVYYLKSNYQLGELVKVDNYSDTIKRIAEFTCLLLKSHQK